MQYRNGGATEIADHRAGRLARDLSILLPPATGFQEFYASRAALSRVPYWGLGTNAPPRQFLR